MQVLDKGLIKLNQVLASDLGVVASARVSNGATFEEASKGELADSKLINYLIKHKHGTPFEHNLFTFYIDAPLFVRSEWHRHRIGWSYNEVSRRYVDSEPKFYIPEIWRSQSSSNKQASGEPFHKDSQISDLFTEDLERACHRAVETYNWWIKQGMAKEMARMILPQNMYTQFYASCNARSLMHWLNLRNHDNAQFEIRQYAVALEGIFKEQMPLTYQAFINNGRIAP